MIQKHHQEIPVVLLCAAGEPHSAVVQDALYGWPIEVGEPVMREVSVFELPEEVLSLLGLSHLVWNVRGLGEVGWNVNTKEFEALYPGNLLSVNWVLHASRCAEVHTDFLGFGDVLNPGYFENTSLSSAELFSVVWYQMYGGIISKFDNGVSGVNRRTVMCEYGAGA